MHVQPFVRSRSTVISPVAVGSTMVAFFASAAGAALIAFWNFQSLLFADELFVDGVFFSVSVYATRIAASESGRLSMNVFLSGMA